MGDGVKGYLIRKRGQLSYWLHQGILAFFELMGPALTFLCLNKNETVETSNVPTTTKSKGSTWLKDN